MGDKEQLHRIHPVIRERARQLRRPLTPAENWLWQRLRAKRLAGLKFRRQHPVGPFILDFYCAQHRLAVELDGDSHAAQVERDENRTEWLLQRGYRVIRFGNRDVLTNLEGVLTEIARQCNLPSVIDEPYGAKE